MVTRAQYKAAAENLRNNSIFTGMWAGTISFMFLYNTVDTLYENFEMISSSPNEKNIYTALLVGASMYSYGLMEGIVTTTARQRPAHLTLSILEKLAGKRLTPTASELIKKSREL